MQRILVTGATGNVGREIVSQLLATDVLVRAMVRIPESANLGAQGSVLTCAAIESVLASL